MSTNNVEPEPLGTSNTNNILRSTQTSTITTLGLEVNSCTMPPTSELDPLGQLFEGQFIHAWSLFKELKYDEVKSF